MSKGLEALKETAIQIVDALYGKEEPLRNNKINELLETKQFKCIEKELKALELLKLFDFKIEDYTEDLNGSVKAMGTIILDDEEIDLLKEVLL